MGGESMNRTVNGSDDQARFQTASVHQVLPSSMHGGLVCLCGKELPKHRDATEHIIDAYDKARRQDALDRAWHPMTRTVAGSVYYQDDYVTLYHGDCLQATEWLAADVLVTDPPYGIGYDSGWTDHDAIANDATTVTRDRALAAWSGAAAVFASWRCQPYGEPHPMPLVWDKGDVVGMGDLSWPWRPSYELVWIYGSGWAGKRGPAVLRHRVLPGNFTIRRHPTEKPVAILVDLLGHAPPGTVSDPFAGSGSTLVAAKLLGRQAIGVEIDERYCEVAAGRLSQDVLVES